MIEIIPTIIAKSKEELESDIRRLEPYVERVHLDIMDGAFTASKSILGYTELQSIETKLHFTVHLMVTHPEEYVPQWLKIPNADGFAIQAESDGSLKEVFLEIRNQGKKAGIVLNPETLTGSISEYLPMVDFVQFMTVHPGFYGSPFLNDVIDKISEFHDDNPDMPIAVDGGINPETARRVVEAGAEILLSGSYIMNSPDVAKAIAELKDNFQ